MIKQLLIFALIVYAIGLTIWVMLLDSKVHDLKGYIKRIEKKNVTPTT